MIVGFDLLDSPDLPDDFFDEDLKALTEEEPRLVFVDPEIIKRDTEAAGMNYVPVSGLISVDLVEERYTAGYKYPQPPRYVIENDKEPAQKVLSWIKKFYSGDGSEFPFIPVGAPVIPPSQYAKYPDIGIIDSYMVSLGYRILRPSVRQLTLFPGECDEEVRMLLFYPKAMNLDVTVGTTSLCNYVSDKYRVFEFGSKESRSLFKRTLQERRQSAIKLALKMQRRLARTRYFVRDYRPKDDKSSCLVVGLSINPYSPYIVSDLRKLEFREDGIQFEKVWKGDIVSSFFCYKAKRYHSEAWYSEIFSDTVYNKAILSLDMVVNSYNAFEKNFFFKSKHKKNKKQFMTVPFLVDPFEVTVKYNPDRVRAPIHYRYGPALSTLSAYLPYTNTYITHQDQHLRISITGDEIKFPIKHHLFSVQVEKVTKVTLFLDGRYREYDDREFMELVRQKRQDYNRRYIDDEEYKAFIFQAKQYFLHRERYVKNNRVKNKKYYDKIVRTKTIIYRQSDTGESMDYVPYPILRYPNNPWGSLVPNFLVLTLEEFCSQYHYLRKQNKIPNWLYKMDAHQEPDEDFKIDLVMMDA